MNYFEKIFNQLNALAEARHGPSVILGAAILILALAILLLVWRTGG